MKETIVFGGGCFWCMEAAFQMLRGVQSVDSGYTGGKTVNPTYEEVSTGKTGHAEVVRVIFDSEVIKLNDLLGVFFTTHDPTSLNRQGNDIGEQYRSAIFYSNKGQKQAVQNFIKKLTEDNTFLKPIITEVLPMKDFYPAEDYHKNYYKNNPDQAYCQVVINPKITKLRQKYLKLIR
jgi:peptide-methionine (S)-S-oxide reductase